MIAITLPRKWDLLHPEAIANSTTRRLQRNEEARFYHYKTRNCLSPLPLSPQQRR